MCFATVHSPRVNLVQLDLPHELYQLVVMSTPSEDGVRCTVHDGEVSMHLDHPRVPIPSRILNQSKVLLDTLTSACDSSATKSFTLAAPTEWLQAWVACFVTEEQSLGYADDEVLVKCLMVRFHLHSTAFRVLFSHAIAPFQFPGPASAALTFEITSSLCF
jgi:hypothetical protein